MLSSSRIKQKGKRNAFCLLLFIFCFIVGSYCTVGCNGKKPSTGETNNNNTAAVFTPSVPENVESPVQVQQPPQQVTDNLNQNTNTEEGLVHIFKYTGRSRCDYSVEMDVDEMELQLWGIHVHDRYRSKDGRERSGCYITSGDMNVYVIDKSSLQSSEAMGFCECTPDYASPTEEDGEDEEGKSICVPYEYASPPSSGCM